MSDSRVIVELPFLKARDLQITWGDTTEYWTWTSMSESRSAEVAQLERVAWLEITGKVLAESLSTKGEYVAYLRYKLLDDNYGFENPIKVSIGEDVRELSLIPKNKDKLGKPQDWWELELGDFSVPEQGHVHDVRIKLYETEVLDWKRGLVVDGMRIVVKE